MGHKIIMGQAALILVCALATPAFGQDNVQGLMMKCDNSNASDQQFYCYGRVTAVFEMMLLNGVTIAQHDHAVKTMLSVCEVGHLPSYGAQVQAFINWAKKHPEKWNENDLDGIMTALQETWPCQ